MKKSAIRQMLYGERGNVQLIKTSKEYDVQSNIELEATKKFYEKLSDEMKIIFAELSDIINASETESADYHYIEGFKFGLLMGLEIAEE